MADLLSQFGKAAPEKYQRVVSDMVEVALFNEMTTSSEVAAIDRARLIDLSNDYVSSWITTYPSEKAYVLTDDTVKIAFRLHMGEKPMESLPNKCHRCGKSFASDPWHPFSCEKGKKKGSFMVHENVVHTISDTLNSVGIYSSTKANVYGDGFNFPGANPDIMVQLPQSGVVLDVVSTHILAKSYIKNKSALVRGQVLNAKDNKKFDHHMELARVAGFDFIAIAISSLGAFSKDALKFFELAEQAEANRVCYQSENLLLQRPSFFNRLVRSVSIASRVGMAALINMEYGASRSFQRNSGSGALGVGHSDQRLRR